MTQLSPLMFHKAPAPTPKITPELPRERFPFTLVTETGRCTVHVWGTGKEDALRRFRQMRAER